MTHLLLILNLLNMTIRKLSFFTLISDSPLYRIVSGKAESFVKAGKSIADAVKVSLDLLCFNNKLLFITDFGCNKSWSFFIKRLINAPGCMRLITEKFKLPSRSRGSQGKSEYSSSAKQENRCVVSSRYVTQNPPLFSMLTRRVEFIICGAFLVRNL